MYLNLAVRLANVLNCICCIPRRMLNTVLFAACFSYKISLVALVATDCPYVLIQSYCNLFMPSNPRSIREHHLSLQGIAGCFPTKTSRFKSFWYNWKSIWYTSIVTLMAVDISKRFIHPVACSAWSSIASLVLYDC